MTIRNRVLEDHVLVVHDGRIVDLIASHDAASRYLASVTLERPNHVLMPGLINAHSHAAMSLMRGFTEGLPLASRLDSRMWPLEKRFVSPDFVRDGTLIAIAEMLKSGITCFADQYFYPDETARVATQQGIRAVIGTPVAEFSTPWAQNADEYLTKALSVHDEYKGHPSISTAFAPLSAYTIEDATFRRIATYANELDAPILIRLHESSLEITESVARYGSRPIERLHSLGLLTPALNAIHMLHVNPSDIELAVQSGISVTLCPESNLKRGNGASPVALWVASGLRLAVGSDGAASHNDQDIWMEMKLLTLLSRTNSEAISSVTPWDALSIATRSGAAALGLEDEIGSLEPGKWADLCCIDLSGPGTQPVYDPLAQLVFSGGRDLVTDVWVAGRHLLVDRNYSRLDWSTLAARANIWAAKLKAEG